MWEPLAKVYNMLYGLRYKGLFIANRAHAPLIPECDKDAHISEKAKFDLFSNLIRGSNKM